MLKYAHERGCPWDEWTCRQAAEHGHFDVLKYLRENGCDWDGYVLFFAEEYGHKEMLEYARKNGCPRDVKRHDYEYSFPDGY